MKRELYPANWRAISLAIRERSGGACECTGQCGAEHDDGRCGAPNGALIVRHLERPWEWREHNCHSVCLGELCPGRKVVLTVAHLDHDPSHNDPSNLLALCQRCHLVLDAGQHAASARATRRGRKAAAELPGTEARHA